MALDGNSVARTYAPELRFLESSANPDHDMPALSSVSVTAGRARRLTSDLLEDLKGGEDFVDFIALSANCNEPIDLPIRQAWVKKVLKFDENIALLRTDILDIALVYITTLQSAVLTAEPLSTLRPCSLLPH